MTIIDIASTLKFSMLKNTLLGHGFLCMLLSIVLPIIAIFGMQNINYGGSNLPVIILYLLIAVIVVSISLSNLKFSDRFYTSIIYLIGLSLILLYVFRSDYLIGRDSHQEYLLFQSTLASFHYGSFFGNPLDSCLSITIIPVIYQQILNIPKDLLFRSYSALIFSISPVVVFTISRKLLNGHYAFLSSLFFVSQVHFLQTTSFARINIAILFFLLAIMLILTSQNQRVSTKICFMAILSSVVVSHYSTAYIVGITLATTYVVILLLKFFTNGNINCNDSNMGLVNFKNLMLFFSILFLWYALVSHSAFSAGVGFVDQSLQNALELLCDTNVTRDSGILQAFQLPDTSKSNILLVLYIKFFINWSAIILIFLGLITVSRELLHKPLKRMFIPNEFSSHLKKINPVYLIVCIIGSSLMLLNILIPSIGYGYDLSRLHFMFIGVLSPLLVLGVLSLLNMFREVISITNPGWLSSLKRFSSIRDTRIYGTITAVYILIFLSCSMGIIDFTLGRPTILLDHNSDTNDAFIISEPDSFAAKWICHTRSDDYMLFFSKPLGYLWMSGQCGVNLNERRDVDNDIRSNKLDSYYLSHNPNELYIISTKNKLIKIYDSGVQTYFFISSTDIQ